MMEVLARLFEFLAIVWLARFVLRNLLGGSGQKPPFNAGGGSSGPRRSESGVISGGEMKKDPQCGTYVSTELSLKSTYGKEVLHFCSRACQEQYLQSHSSKPA